MPGKTREESISSLAVRALRAPDRRFASLRTGRRSEPFGAGVAEQSKPVGLGDTIA